MRRFPWFEALLIAAVMSLGLYAALSDAQNLPLRWFTRDDAYYYFKVAQNISEGHGSTFDGLNPTNGYHPLWMLICIPIFSLARFDLILPLRVLLLLMSGLSAATGVLLYRLIGRIFAPAIGAMTALFWVFSYDVRVIVYQQGLETGIAAFFIVLLLHKLLHLENNWRKNEVRAGQIAALAVLSVLVLFSRLDLLFFAGMVGLWIVFRGHPLRYFLPLDIVSIIVATLLAFIVRVGFQSYYQYADLALTMVGLGLIVKIPTMYLLGLYQHPQILRTRSLVIGLIVSSAFGSAITGLLILASLQLGLLQGQFPRSVILWDFAFSTALPGLSRIMFMGLHDKPSARANEEQKRPTYLIDHWRTWIKEASIYYGIVFGALGIYMVWNRFAFGTASPVSGQIKQWWASLPGRAYGGRTRDVLSFFGINFRTDSNAWNPVSSDLGSWAESIFQTKEQWAYLLVLGLIVVIFYLLLFAIKKKGKAAITQMGIIPLVSGASLQVLYYNAIGYAAHKEWYWITQLIIIVLSFSLIAGMLFKLSRGVRYRHAISWTLAAFVGLSMGTSYWNNIRDLMPYGFWAADSPFIDVAPLIEERTEPGSAIGLTGGGNAGYFIPDRTVVNMDGLINSYPYFEALRAGQGGAYLNSIGLDYVLANQVILDQQPYKGQFNEYLNPLDVYYGGKQLMRYTEP